MSKNASITVAYGDGIGPEIMEAVLEILSYSSAKLTIETVEVGEKLYTHGYNTGIGPDLWESLRRTKVILKSPITTPQGGGYKSLNVTMRKILGLYANVRPCVAYSPFVKTVHPDLNVVIVRENEEDLYVGAEYRQTHNVSHALKLISRTACDRIIRYAFEYAKRNNRKKVTCMTKDNIMKMTDGTFHKAFDEIAKEYTDIEANHFIIDIGSAKLANRPTLFDVIVTENLYGDIISDIVAEVSGSVGLAGSANIGQEYAMFEAIHGSAPLIAGKNTANPSGLLHAAIMMLVHVGQGSAAAQIHNAWLATLEDGMHTYDIYNPELSKEKLGTKEFGKEVIKRLGQLPKKMAVVNYSDGEGHQDQGAATGVINTSEVKQLVGVDVFFNWQGKEADELAQQLVALADGELKLQNISCIGLKVWPYEELAFNKGFGDYWCTRFVPNNPEKKTSHQQIIHLLNRLSEAKLDFVKTEHLYSFNDKPGFSLGQGE